MSDLIKDLRGMVVLFITIGGIIGTLQFTVFVSNNFNKVAENLEEAPEIVGEIIEEGAKEIAESIRIEVYLVIFLMILSVIGGLVKAFEN